MGAHSETLLLLNLGGPASQSEVEPFLNEFLNDVLFPSAPQWVRKPLIRGFAKLRAPTSRGYYGQIGGGSPLQSITRQQTESLELALQKKFKVHHVMRFSNPRFSILLDSWSKDFFPSKLVLLPLFPQYSRATTESSVKEILSLFKGSVELIPSWYRDSSYIDFFSNWIVQYLQKMNLKNEEIFFLFTAHGLPERAIEQGDPYLNHTMETVRLLVSRLGVKEEQTLLGFQSRFGKSSWLKPFTEACLNQIASMRRFQKVILIPVSFVSDHVETLYELDIFIKERAEKLGLSLYRLPMFNDAKDFIDVLKFLVCNAPRKEIFQNEPIPYE